VNARVGFTNVTLDGTIKPDLSQVESDAGQVTVNERFALCDLPGYGFAKVPKAVRQSWSTMVESYLEHRDELLALAVITDVRRGFEEDDLQLVTAAGQLGIQPILVATKCDKLTRNALTTQKRRMCDAIGADLEHGEAGRILPRQQRFTGFLEGSECEADASRGFVGPKLVTLPIDDQAHGETGRDDVGADFSFGGKAEAGIGPVGAGDLGDRDGRLWQA